MIRERPLEGKVAFVSGASRGIGKQIALELSKAGAVVLGNSVDPRKQRRVNETIAQAPGRMEWVFADVASPEGRAAIVQSARAVAAEIKPENPSIDLVYLNAAGGLETDKPDGWAHKINIESQDALVQELGPYMSRGGAFVNVTSLWSEGFGRVRQLPYYRPVAKTKHLGEKKLRERIPELAKGDVSLLFLCGNIIQGTAAYNLFVRSSPEMIESLRRQYQAQTGNEAFPEAEDMGKAAVAMVLEPPRSGHTEYVGKMSLDPIPTNQIDAYSLSEDQVRLALPMYGNTAPYNKLYVHRFDSPAEDSLGDAKETGRGYYTVPRADTAGHFTGDYNDLRLFRGVDQIEQVAQVGGLILIGLESGSKMVPLFTDIEGGEVHWKKMIEPGDQLIVDARITNMNPAKTRVEGEIHRIDGKLVSSFSGLTFALAPSIDYVRSLKARQ